jgi:hypothetical protein
MFQIEGIVKNSGIRFRINQESFYKNNKIIIF